MLAGRVLGWLGFGAASTVAASCALVPLALGRAGGQPLLAGLPLLLVGLVLAGAARVAGGGVFRQLTAGLLVPLLAVAVLRPVAELRAGFLLLAAGLVTAGLAGAVRLLPQRHRTGPRVGALLVAAGSAQVAGSPPEPSQCSRWAGHCPPGRGPMPVLISPGAGNSRSSPCSPPGPACCCCRGRPVR